MNDDTTLRGAAYRITVPVSALRAAAGASAIAGLLHYTAVPGHRPEWWAAALFFTLLGAFQIVWAALAWFDQVRPILWPGILINAGTLAVWTVSRTAGLPFGPHAGEPEAIGALDIASGLAELVVLAVLLLLLRPRSGHETA